MGTKNLPTLRDFSLLATFPEVFLFWFKKGSPDPPSFTVKRRQCKDSSMGNCKYCGKPAGFLRGKHTECERQREQKFSEMLQLTAKSVEGLCTLDSLHSKLSQLAEEGFMSQSEIRDAIVQSWETAVDRFLEDGVLSESEEAKLISLRNGFNLTQGELDRRGAYSRVAKAGVLRDLLEGKLPERVTIEGNLPFNFQKNEKVVWLFNGVAYLEDKTRTQYVGRSSGASIRICKGVYYRVGAFQGQPVSRTERVHVDTGGMAVTNKYVYFGGIRKSLRIAHSKIVSFIPYTDGVGIMRDATNAKQQVFVTGDGWFTYNLLANVSQL